MNALILIQYIFYIFVISPHYQSFVTVILKNIMGKSNYKMITVMMFFIIMKIVILQDVLLMVKRSRIAVKLRPYSVIHI